MHRSFDWLRIRIARGAAVVLVSLLALAEPLRAQETPTRWVLDLDHLTAVLPAVHGDAFHRISRTRFDSAAAALRGRLPRLDGIIARAELASLVALIGDGHTRVNLLGLGPGVPTAPDSGFAPLPIRPYLFDDGLFVRSALAAQSDLLGARILAVQGVPAADVLERLERYVHRDNVMTVRLLLPWFLTRPAFLIAAGIADSAAVRFRFEKRDGRTVVRTLRPVPWVTDAGSDGPDAWIDAADAAGAPVSLARSRNDEPYWFDRIHGGEVLYLQFNAVRDAPEESLEEFAGRVSAALKQDGVDKLVLDLRGNDGGNSTLAVPLIDAIKGSALNRRGSFFVIVGRATFSAGGVVAALFEDRTNAILVGEPTGARPNMWGDMDTFILPESGLSVSYSERFFQTGGPYDLRPSVSPELSAELRFEDYEGGRDPALELALEYRPSPPVVQQLLAALEASGPDSALALYDELMSTPRKRYYWSQDDLSALGIRLWLSDRVRASIPVWERMARAYPESAEGFENLAETHAALGDRSAALEALEAALAIDPRNGDALELLQELCGATAVRLYLSERPAISTTCSPE